MCMSTITGTTGLQKNYKCSPFKDNNTIFMNSFHLVPFYYGVLCHCQIFICEILKTFVQKKKKKSLRESEEKSLPDQLLFFACALPMDPIPATELPVHNR